MFDPLGLLKEQFESNKVPPVWKEGMITSPGPGHTREVHELSEKHAGPGNASYYTATALFGALDASRGLGLLRELAKLQVTDPTHPQFGGLRWYREETKIADTNGAFFVLQPLVVLRLLRPDLIPTDHLTVLDPLMRQAIHWFGEECANPILYYPNKIMSDGALLVAMAGFFNDAEGLSQGIAFWKRWDEYTDRRGWGWGENISVGYLAIIVGALQIARLALANHEPALANKLKQRIVDLFAMVRFHGGKEFVPTIRSYNYLGNETVFGWLQTVARTREDVRDVLGEAPQGTGSVNYGAIVSLHLFQDFLTEGLKAPLPAPTSKPCIRQERIFDKTFAYTWMGENLRLGSLNRYPNIPGCYQKPTWGLGWQSMPLNFLVEGHQSGFARMYTKVGENLRCHPGMGHHASYLSPALFEETSLPELLSIASQSGPALVALRSLGPLAHKASLLQDTWVVNRFVGEVFEVTVPQASGSLVATKMKGDNAAFQAAEGPAGDRSWVILFYPHATLAFSALSTLDLGDMAPRSGKITFDKGEDDILYLRQTLYQGPEILMRQDRVEAGWVVLAFDRNLDRSQVAKELSQVMIQDVSEPDFEVPRDGWSLQRKINLTQGATQVSLEFDPLYL